MERRAVPLAITEKCALTLEHRDEKNVSVALRADKLMGLQLF